MVTKTLRTSRASTAPLSFSPSSTLYSLLVKIPTREAEMLQLRFGLGQNEKHTLEAIGQKFGITRERVRQIEGAAIKKLSSFVPGTTVVALLDYTKDLLMREGGLVEMHTLLRGLLDAIGSKKESDAHYIELALVTSANITTVHNTIKFHPYFHLHTISEEMVARVTQLIIAGLKKDKKVRDFNSLADMIKKEAGVSFEPLTMMQICRISKELKVTDNAEVGLFAWTHINPRNIHDKILYVLREGKKPLHFCDITQKITDRRFDEKRVHVQAVHNELIRNESFVLIGRGIYALKEWGYTPGTVNEVVTDILRTHGKLEREKIVEEVLKVREVKRITIMLNLKNKKLFERVGRNMYSLR